MKILITGHKGYIGSHLYNKLIDDHDVYGVDIVDGEDAMFCLPEFAVDVVFHLAAYPRVQFSVERPYYTCRQNVLTTSRLLEWCKNNNVKKFIFSSSSAVRGDGDDQPKSPYGLHKLMSEMECKLYKQLYDLHCVCLRYFNVYSGDQPYQGSYTTAISSWMEMIRQNKPLRIDGDGEQTRDFVHVDDVVSANILAMNSDDMTHDYYEVGCGVNYSLNYIKRYIDKRFDVEWKHAPARAGDARHTKARNSTLMSAGWRPSVDMDQGLEECFNIVAR